MLVNFVTYPITCHIIVLIPFAALFFIFGLLTGFMETK